MLLMSLEEGKSRRDLEQEGWVGVGVGRKEYPHLSLKTTSPTCHAPQELQRMLCETGMLMGNLLGLESKMYPASSVAPRYYPDLKKPLEILSFICLSVLPSVHQIFISGFSNPNSIWASNQTSSCIIGTDKSILILRSRKMRSKEGKWVALEPNILVPTCCLLLQLLRMPPLDSFPRRTEGDSVYRLSAMSLLLLPGFITLSNVCLARVFPSRLLERLAPCSPVPQPSSRDRTQLSLLSNCCWWS